MAIRVNDYSSTIACAYIVYLLLCLKDPARYYGKPPGDSIDILNIAINSAQANNVFFKGFKRRVDLSPWFQGKFEAKAGQIAFEKNVNVYSGHSEREAWEGYNCLYIVLDEISGFALESTSGNEQSKTAKAVYDMYRGSVDSRFPDYGKVVLLSFPRFKNDFIQQKYDSVVADKEVVDRVHRFKINEELPDDSPGNEFDVHWEEDHIVSYTLPKVFALKRPTWEVNPTKPIDSFKIAFMRDKMDALARFACMPPDAIDAFFKDRQKIENAFVRHNAVSEDGTFEDWFLPKDGARYFMHVDLARKHDHCAVALAHVETWKKQRIGAVYTEPSPYIVIDCVRWWTPTKDKNVDFADVREFIVSVRQRGFDLRLVTFDRWESDDMMSYLNAVGIRSERLSVAKRHYDDFALTIHDERVTGPAIDLLKEELLQLRIMNNDKVDHPRKGCFVGDTRISLLDGTRPMISELEGRDAWVYSCKEDGTIVPGMARGRYTKHVDTLIDVVLDSGAVVRCTPEHRWMLRNGEYKEAQHLRPGIDRLMPINQLWPVNGGYEKISGKDGPQGLTHHMVIKGQGGVVPEGHIVHHKNHIKTDNNPENLCVQSLSEHTAHHTKGRHDDEDYRESLYSGLRRFNSREDVRKKRSEHMKGRSLKWHKARARSSKAFRSDITIDSLVSVRGDAEATNANSAARILGCSRNVVVRVLGDHGYSSWEEFLTDDGVNHKVRHVIWVKLDTPVPVYDLEVDKWENFALSCGVFVHNSKDLSDAVCGSIYNAIAHTPRNLDQEIEVHDYDSIREFKPNKIEKPKGLIEAPTRRIPDDLSAYLESLDFI